MGGGYLFVVLLQAAVMMMVMGQTFDALPTVNWRRSNATPDGLISNQRKSGITKGMKVEGKMGGKDDEMKKWFKSAPPVVMIIKHGGSSSN